MIKIPVYQQHTQPSGFINSHADAIAVKDPIGSSLGDLGKAMGDVSNAEVANQVVDNQILLKQQRANEDLTALKNASQASMDLQDTVEKMKGEAKPGAFGFTGDVRNLVSKYIDDTKEQGGSDYYLQQFDRKMIPVAQALSNHAMLYEAQEARAHRLNLVSEAVTNSSKTVSQNPDMFDIELGRIVTTLNADKDNPYGLLPHQRDTALKGARDSLSDAVIWRMIQDNPAQAKATIYKSLTGLDPKPIGGGTGQAGFDSSVNWVLGQEGGYVAKDGKSGAPANFGINQRANPDIDVKGLTRDGAVSLYRDRYWNAINADNLPPQTAMVAFDTAVNMGVPMAKRLLAETGGDPATMIARRREIYTSMGEDAGQRPYLKNWLGRMDKLESAVGAIPGTAEQPDPVAMGVRDPTKRTSTGIPAIDVADPRRLEGWLQTANTELHKADANARQSLDKTFTDHIAMMKDGVLPQAPLSRAQILSAYQTNPIEGMQKADTYTDAIQVGKNVGAMKMLPTAQLSAYLNRKPDPNSSNYAREEQLLGAQSAAAESILKQRNDDFIGWAAKNGLQGIAQINFGDPKSIAAEMPKRLALANLARDWGVHDVDFAKGPAQVGEKADSSLITKSGQPYPMLSNLEAQHFTEYVNKLNSGEKVDLLGNIRQAVGVNGLNTLMGQISKDAPMLAFVGTMSGMQTTKDRNIGKLILDGQDLLKAKQITIPNDVDTNDKFQQIMGKAIQTNEGRSLAMDAVSAVYAKLRYEAGEYHDKAFHNDTYDQAVRLVTGGGPIEWNGSKVLRPTFGADDATSRNLLGGVNADQVKQWGSVSGMDDAKAAEFIRKAPLESSGAGRYRVQAGAGVLHRKDGSVFELVFH